MMYMMCACAAGQQGTKVLWLCFKQDPMSSKILHTLVIENRGDTPPCAHAICLVYILLSDWYSEIVHRLHKLQCEVPYT
jgi:hypothetical protein